MKNGGERVNLMINTFNEESYLEANEDVKMAIENGDFSTLEQYMELHGLKGIKEGLRQFHKDFDPFDEALYLENFPEVKLAVEEGDFSSAFEHFLHHGYKEIIVGHRIWPGVRENYIQSLMQNFDEAAYFDVNLDVKEALKSNAFDSLEDYLRIHGLEKIAEGLTPFHKDHEPFNEVVYLEQHPKLAEAIEEDDFVSAFDHFCRVGYVHLISQETSYDIEYDENFDMILECNAFDKEYYLEINEDIAKSNKDLLMHYLKYGWKEGRKPNSWFDPLYYLEKYDDVKISEMEPLTHFLVIGKSEGRETLHPHENDTEDYLSDEEIDIVRTEFDKDYYLNTYIDIKDANIDPLKHFCMTGWKEFRNPNEDFNTKYYIDNNADVKESNINPLLHYINVGKKENRRISPPTEKTVDIKVSLDLFNTEIMIPKFKNNSQIDIIIPVYNGKAFLKPLFKSLIKNTTLPYRLLICDDKSPDKTVLPLLKKFRDKNKDVDITIFENEENLGFLKTVNRLSVLTNNHFVLLNTDTEVPPNWLERLMYPIFSMDNIASTTPFTNSGTICSFPNYLEDNAIYNNMKLKELDHFFQYVNFENSYIEIPTGVGFCMGVNKDLVDKIGMFDEIFGKGYGEENDWCQRAIENGYKNIHVPNLFVYHKHGGSFSSDEKEKLLGTNSSLLLKKHKSYNDQVQSIVAKNELDNLRNLLRFRIESAKNYSVLIIDHSLGGGANQYTANKIDELLENSQVVCLMYFDYYKMKQYHCRFIMSTYEFTFSTDSIMDLFYSLKLFNFDEIFLNSIVSYPNMRDIINLILKIKNESKLIVPIHDFFPLCPSYTLLDDKMVYCDVPKDHDKCKLCLKNHKGEFKSFVQERNIDNWRDNWGEIFDVSDDVLCFSNSSKEIFSKAYLEFTNKVIVIPHDISGRFTKIYNENLKVDVQRIGILGNLNEAKGAKIVEQLVDYIDVQKLNTKIILIGSICINIKSDSFYKTGSYNHDNLPDLVKELNITEFFIPSIWPETFSYTTDEIMQLGYPLTVFNIGAPAERVKHYKLGKIIKIDDFKSIIRTEA